LTVQTSNIEQEEQQKQLQQFNYYLTILNMALSTTGYAWQGLTISPYAKITRKQISDYTEEGVKKFRCTYWVSVYTSDTKEGDVKQSGFEVLDVVETISNEELYLDLKTRDEFLDWVDA
jgi:hypothetical protein